MGYSFTKEMHVGCSDVAADFCYGLGYKIVSALKEHEKVKENCYNTDGILNVAMILADCFSNEEWRINPVTDYINEIASWDNFIAGMAGMIKDVAEANGETVEAQILNRPDFEHLEAKGQEKVTEGAKKAMEEVAKIVKIPENNLN